MTKQYNNRGAYRITLNHHYIVTIEFHHWTNNGVAVYDAEIINLDRFTDTWAAAHHYRFTGHSMSEADEARHIAMHHEAKDEAMRGCKA